MNFNEASKIKKFLILCCFLDHFLCFLQYSLNFQSLLKFKNLIFPKKCKYLFRR